MGTSIGEVRLSNLGARLKARLQVFLALADVLKRLHRPPNIKIAVVQWRESHSQ